MNYEKTAHLPVTHRTKGNTLQVPEYGNLVDEPEMKALLRLINAEDLNLARTIFYLEIKRASGLTSEIRGGGGCGFRDGS